jgi:hypothetical protein
MEVEMSDYTAYLNRNSMVERTPVIVFPPEDLRSACPADVLRCVVGEERADAALALIGEHIEVAFAAPRRDLISAFERAEGQAAVDGVAALAVIAAGWRVPMLTSIEAIGELSNVMRLIQVAECHGDALWVSALEVVRQRIHVRANLDAPPVALDGSVTISGQHHPRDLAAGLSRLIAAIETVGADLIDARLEDLPRVVVLAAGGSDAMTAVQRELSAALPVLGIVDTASPGRLPMLVALGGGVVGEVFVISAAHFEAERQLANIADLRANEVQAAFRDHRRPSFARFDQAAAEVERAAADLYAGGEANEVYIAQQLTIAAEGVSMRGVEMAA